MDKAETRNPIDGHTHLFAYLSSSSSPSVLVCSAEVMTGGAMVGSGGGREYPGKLTFFVFVTCFVAATGGLIFGYDIGISGGVTSMDSFLEKFFPDAYRKEESTNQYCMFNSQLLTTFTSSLYLAAPVASFVASEVTSEFGRKWSMFGRGVTFLVGAALNGAAENVLMLILGRILLGIGVGFANQVCTLSFRFCGSTCPRKGHFLFSSEESKLVEHPWANIIQRTYRPQLIMAILIPFFQQLTGINVIVFYAPVLFKTMGFGDNSSLISAVITGIVNLFATFVSFFTVDKLGRRKLFLEGGLQIFISQIVIGILMAIKLGTTGEEHFSKTYSTLLVIFICIYVMGFAWSWGPLGWLVPSEIFPLEIRSAGQSINVSVNMLFTFIIAQAFLAMLCHFKFPLFYFFCGWEICDICHLKDQSSIKVLDSSYTGGNFSLN